MAHDFAEALGVGQGMQNHPSPVSVLRNFTEIFVFVAVVIADALGFVPLSQTIFLVPLVWISLRLRNERWSTIGFAWPESLSRSIAIGVFAGVLLELFAVYVTTPQISAFFGVEPDYSELKDTQGNLALLFVFLGISWILAAFGEEICFRGLLMNRLARMFGGNAISLSRSLHTGF